MTLARAFGLAGLLPQILCVGAVLHGQYAAPAVMFGFGYALLIYSLLGGLWWGIASSQPIMHLAQKWLWVAAITPSLFDDAVGCFCLVIEE